MPTFRNILFHLHSQVGVKNSSHLPAYENGTECSETSVYKIQTPGNYPKKSIQHYEFIFCFFLFLVFGLWFLFFFVFCFLFFCFLFLFFVFFVSCFFWFAVAYCIQLLSQAMYNLMMVTNMAETCSC